MGYREFAESTTRVHLSTCAHMCFPFQKVCFCWKPISPRACWCLESSHPQGKAAGDEANCNIPAGLSGYVNHRLDISRRGCACQRAFDIETSCVMHQISLVRGWAINYSPGGFTIRPSFWCPFPLMAGDSTLLIRLCLAWYVLLDVFHQHRETLHNSISECREIFIIVFLR